MKVRWDAARGVVLPLAFVATLAIPQTVNAQVSRDDSSTVLLQSARQLWGAGEDELARDILRFIIREFPGTPQARESRALLDEVGLRSQRGSGATGLIVWNTLYGAWLGIAVPAAFGAESAPPFGVGLLIGPALGFITTKAFTTQHSMSVGQTVVTSFGSYWGAYQAAGWREVFDWGTEKFSVCCQADGTEFIVEEDSDQIPFVAAVIGGVSGLFIGAGLAQRLDPSSGGAWLATMSAWWGSWYGIAGTVLADIDSGDARLAWTLVSGNVGLIAGALLAPAANMTTGRAWLITAAGLAGGLGGVGLALIAEVDDAQTVVLLASLGSTIGLVAGTLTTRNTDNRIATPEFGPSNALLHLSGSRLRLGPPLPQPVAFTNLDAAGRTRTSIGVRVTLFEARF